MPTELTAWKKTDGPVRYHGTTDTVELGDKIEVRSLFGKRKGTVTYVPGISKVNDEMEHGSMHWVGITFDARNLFNGIFSGVLVDPDSGHTLLKLRLLERGDLSGVEAFPDAPFD